MGADQETEREMPPLSVDGVRPDDELAAVEHEPPEETTPDEVVRNELVADLTEWFGLGTDEEGTDAFPAPDEAFLAESFFDFSYLDGRKEVERYWVNEPFAYVSILYDEEQLSYAYHITEPALDEFEQYVRSDLVQVIRNSLMYRDIDEDGRDRRAVFEDELRTILDKHAATVDAGSIQKLRYYLVRDFVDFGRIDPLMRDPGIEDISCDGSDVPVFVYHRQYRDLRTNAVFNESRLNSLVVRLAQRAGKHLSISDPLVDASLPDGSRVQLTLGGDIASRGSNFTIRKFSEVPYTPVDLINWNTFSIDQMAYLWLCIENNRSLVFAGGTGSGKTTSLNAVSFFIPPDSKVVSIEDTREIVLPHDNWVQSLTRDAVGGRGDIDTYRLLQAALRQRPEYLLVGEIRTDPRVAMTFFQAISTGHTCYTTIHADSIEGALSRLENPPLSVPAQMLAELNIVSIQKQASVGNERPRRNHTIAELGVEYDSLKANTVFRRDAKSDTHEQVGDSQALQEVADLHGWDDKRLKEELADRRRVLEYLVEKDITDYQAVGAVIHGFQRNPDHVREAIERGDLSPERLGNIR